MNRDDEIKRILLDILQVGLLKIRAYGNSGLAEACSVQADHLHNLPPLVQSLQWELLLYYYNVERPAFLNATQGNTNEFQVLWNELGSLIQAK